MGFWSYPEGLADGRRRVVAVAVAVGLGGIGSACPLQLAGGANCPLSCGEHCGGADGQLEVVDARLMRALRLKQVKSSPEGGLLMT